MTRAARAGYNGTTTNSTTNAKSDSTPEPHPHTSILEPLTQSELHYIQEYLPVMWKRQIIDYWYGYGIYSEEGQEGKNGVDIYSTLDGYSHKWSFEVHTPQSLPAAVKRLENDAVRTRLGMFRDVALRRREKK